MSCIHCGAQYCTGTCLAAVNAQNAYNGNAGGFTLQAQGNQWAGQVAGCLPIHIGGATLNIPTPDYGLNEFLEIIADKDDTAACIAFIEKQKQLHDAQVKQLEAMQQQHTLALANAEKEFMNRCGKYRPSISAELMIRIKKMKAFF
jgi:hypothetical protein